MKAGLRGGRLWHLSVLYFMLAAGIYGFVFWAPTIIKSVSSASDLMIAGEVAHTVVTFGNASQPVPLYIGPTGRRELESNSAARTAAVPGGDVTLPDQCCSGREGHSLRNASRGNWTPIELFRFGVVSWPRGLVLATESLMANLSA